jgi:tRNA pseudouridine55 synthase
VNGVLVVDKPAGPTSHDVVAQVRRAFGQPRIGHTGTLDPLATGVLPLVVGQACRLAQFYTAAEKEYTVDVRFGAATPTYDAESLETTGTGAPPEPPGLSSALVEAALPAFRGSFLQTPPPYSAKKIAGVRAYRLARDQQPADVKPVRVTVHRLELLSYDAGLARLGVVCSSGFYVRTLAHDLGQRLACGAHVEQLRRVRVGDFTIANAVPLATIEREPTTAADRLIPMAALLPTFPPAVLTSGGAERAGHGRLLAPDDLVDPAFLGADASDGGDSGRHFRLVDQSGRLVGIAERRADGLLHPAIVLV